MKREEILQRVNDIFCDELDNDKIMLTENTTAEDVDDWDSLSHVQLVVAVEQSFSIQFTSNEIMTWKNVGDMITSIERKATK